VKSEEWKVKFSGKYMKKVLFAAVFAALSGFPALAPCAADTVFNFDAVSRTRYEYQQNLSDLGYSNSDQKSFFRFKFSGGLQAAWNDSIFGYIKITNESRSYIYNNSGNAQYNINEFVVDSLILSIPDILGYVDIKIGRMDLSPLEYGEGFLLADGTPLDGSRTNYFNAAKLKINFPKSKSSVEFIGIYNTATDNVLPVINENSPPTPLNDSNESAFIIYGKTNPEAKSYFEPYFMYKNEDANPSINKQQEGIAAFGSFAKFNLKNSAVVRAQAAIQLSDDNNTVRAGYGGYVFADLPVSILQPFSIGYVYLSGEDPDGTGTRGWDPLFSRYPWMSDLLSYTFTNESGVGYWTNLQMCKADFNVSPFARMSLLLSGAALFANDNMQFLNNNGPVPIFGGGKYRGTLAQAKISYIFSEHFNCYLLGEYFKPGDFYYNAANDVVFVRAEFTAKL